MKIEQSEKEVIVVTGFYLRATADFVKLSRKYESNVTLQLGENSANGKDINEIMMLFVIEGDKLKVRTIGTDAQDCLSALVKCIEGMKHT